MGRWNTFKPSPAPPEFGKGNVLPETTSSWLSRLSLQWVSQFLNVGFSRPLEKEDLWELPPSRSTQRVTNDVEKEFYSRCPMEKRPVSMRNLEQHAATENTSDVDSEQGLRIQTDNSTPNYVRALWLTFYNMFRKRIWISGILMFVADTLKTTTPLLNKILLTWLAESYVWFRLSDDQRKEAPSIGLLAPRGVGFGIGLAFALFAMQESSSLMTSHSLLMSMTTGIYVRTGIVGTIFRKSLRLSGKARSEHSVGKITNMISTDATNVNGFVSLGHYLWIAPIQLILGLGLLIGTLGSSALAGLAVFFAAIPFQAILVLTMANQRKKGVLIADKRVRLMTEVLQGIRLIKFYGWEAFYMDQITKLRTGEIKTIRKSSFALALLIATFTFTPALATVVAFITYSLTGHDLNVAIIFTSLQLFNVIQLPLLFIPLVSQSLVTTIIALRRITTFLVSEELAEPYLLDPTWSSAITIDGDFQWETVPKPSTADDDHDKDQDKSQRPQDTTKVINPTDSKRRWWQTSRADAAQVSEADNQRIGEVEAPMPQEDVPVKEEKPFILKDLKLSIPRGAFVAIVGRIGCGKSSVLQAILGEMRRVHGEVVVADSIAYAAQTPWIKNATLRQNVVFGETDDEQRFRDVVKACALEHDISILPHGENTEIGEKGINLSGGQKARVSIARAAYSSAPVVLLDDPLSAVDSHVGKHLLENCLLQGPLAGRTRVLVTHALHVLEKTDYIYVMDNGAIVEQGNYTDLMAQNATFAHLIKEHGSLDEPTVKRMTKDARDQVGPAKGSDDAADVLMQLEERNVGAVTWNVYKMYLRAAGGVKWGYIVLFLLILNEAFHVSVTLFLGFWSGNTLPNFTQREYIGVYAGLGCASALVSFILTYTFVAAGLVASLKLYKSAFSGVLYSPTSFFDTTPIGRILSRFSKDQDTIDSQLPIIMMQFLSISFSVFGTIGLVFYTFPYLGIIFFPFGILYYIVSVYYRRSSVETKRLDSLLRSILYASYSETLTGLPTIRAYRDQNRSIRNADRGLNMENQASIMTVLMQRWLGIRLDFFGNLVILGIALFSAGLRKSVNPAKIGVVLTYTLGVTQAFAELINIFAQTEQNMNAVERVLHYGELPREGHEDTSITPSPTWPERGTINFRNVELAYREGLPLVLKDVTFQINSGEKIGIVGRTGSGKSSLMQALFRVVELHNGTIEIDDVDISTLHLHDLRERLASVPQDTTLFLGTLRDNLDPQRLRTDAEIISILQRASLLPKDQSIDPILEAKFSLDSIITDEGGNYSTGERQLLTLCRALVRNSKIIVLDEATSNVDVETDSKIQQTINTEFSASTLLCIAHRINTIAHYDRVLVMDDGKVAEFDTVLNLYDREDSVFRSLCDEANLRRADILRIRAAYRATQNI